MSQIDRPERRLKPIRTLSLGEVASLYQTPETTTEKAALGMLLGCGWRQIEARRITAGDVKSARDSVIEVRGKERIELTPVLPETLKLLMELTGKLPDDEPVLRSTRIRNGGTVGLGEDGMSQLCDRLLSRADIGGYTGHDLRRTFGQLVTDAGCDEFVTERLLRHVIPGTGNRYYRYPMRKLVQALHDYSPLRMIGSPVSVGGGGCRLDGEVKFEIGGDGGESNSA